MTAVRRDEPMTVEEFLKWDDGRYELVEGVPRLMAPHTDKHATMQSNLSRAIGNHLIARNAPCRVVSEAPNMHLSCAASPSRRYVPRIRSRSSSPS